MEELNEVSGLLYKKRGGFGKHMPHAWQQRFFYCSKDGVLYYFDIEGPEILKTLTENIVKDTSKSRGRIDLKASCCEFNSDVLTESSSGAPTQFVFQIIPSNGEEKWKLCAPNKDDFDRWSKELLKFSNNKNSELKNSFAPIENKSRSPSTVDFDKPKKLTKLKLKTSNPSRFDFHELILTLAIMNLCFYNLLTSSSIYMKFMYFVIANIVVARTLIQRNGRKRYLDSELSSQVSSSLSNSKCEQEPKIESIISVNPPAGSTLTEVQNPAFNGTPSHTWCKCDSTIFNVRIGPDYNRFKKKAPSGPSLYEPFAVDIFCTNNRIDHASRFFTIPSDIMDVETNHPHVPAVFVIQLQIPSDPPASMFVTVEDGPGWAILMYFKITEDTLQQLKDLNTASPAVKLFAEYCEKCQDEQPWRARFKVIANCSNLDEMGLPQFITSYNAKPVLIRRTGTIFKGKGYIEKNIHVHKFANVAKSSIHMLSSRCSLMYMQIGFVIEGRTDDELPETLFACVAINKPEEERAANAIDIFQ